MLRMPQPENYLRGAELCMEQNYDEIDGILDNVDTVHAGGTERMMDKADLSPPKAGKAHRDLER